ncbi:hypothetical protein [Pseudoruegeria sp. SHC-113]|uniref:hypothetical protein n=1 Tax=Pseudoruegeria sp. SHC-113 TaxID=2855439 RepID=UPI0021BA9C32|nr:hypothetical protein [Pseudoruegeria sp. SHC-113]MCT8160860.1 hypothetical protein [Pseudoruegeria sp. SHC-113]
MLPGYALNLSHSGIGLLRRVEGGWESVGDVSLASGTLGEDLKALRAKARKGRSDAFFCKLVIPNSEVLYTEVAAPGPSDAERLVQIREALEGLTPYSVDELAFDWRLQGDRAQVAAVAQMTLREAEGFALDHKFPPACFVAIPEGSAFEGEPFFGLPHARPEGLSVARDAEAIVILPAVAAKPESPAKPDAKPAPPAEAVEAETAAVPVLETALPAAPERQAPEAPASDVAQPETPESPKALAAALAPRFTLMESPEAFEGPDEAAPAPESPADVPEDDAPAEGIPAFVRAGDSLAPAQPKPAQSKPEKPPAKPAPKPEVSAAALVAARDDLAEGETALPLRSAKDPFPLPQFPAKGQGRAELRRKLLPIGGLAATLALLFIGAQFFGAPNPVDLLRSEAPEAALTPQDETANIDLAALPEAEVSALPEPALIEGAESGGAAPTEEGTVVLASLPEATAPVLLPELPEGETIAPQAEQAPDAPATPAEQAPDTSLADGPRLNLLQGPGSTDSLYVASIDPTTEASDAVALPAPDSFATDAPLAARSNPADAATQFALDENGWVIPTPQGALTPDGVRVFAGSPAKRAALRPEGLAPVDLLTEADPLEGFRPAARPGDLVESEERSRLGGRTLAQLGTLRPAPRPAEVAAVAAAIADAQEAAEAPPPESNLFDLPTERAIARSPRPRVRPEIEVRRVATAAPTATAPAPTARSSDGGAEETGGRTTGQSLSRQEINSKTTTAASVAQQATLKNAINLGKINLIGVYGSDKNRRALIRLSSGRYVKVKVGDRVDGGQVAAIGSNELRYVKSGRNITLTMPKG